MPGIQCIHTQAVNCALHSSPTGCIHLSPHFFTLELFFALLMSQLVVGFFNTLKMLLPNSNLHIMHSRAAENKQKLSIHRHYVVFIA
jgi:hypothetical protein